MSDIIVQTTESQVIVNTEEISFITELLGAPGPAGADGTSGSLTFVQESEPTGGVEGDIWFNPVTGALKVYSTGVWVAEVNDDGFF